MNLDLLEGEIVEDFEIREKIYEGVLSQVHIVRHLPTNSFCISKIYDLSKQSKENLKHITHEIVMYMNTNHPNICRMLSFARNYKKKDIFILFLEYLPYDSLMSYISKLKGLAENEAKFIFLNLFKAVFYLHNDLKVAHRNLSTENIFIDKDNNPKIIGLGSAELIPSVSNENFLNLGNSQTQANGNIQTQVNGNNQNQANGNNQTQANENNVLHSVNETNSYIYQQNEKNEEESKHNHFQKNIEKTEQNFNNENIMNLENEVDMFYGENDDDDDVEYYSDHGIEFDNLNDTSSSMFRTFAGTPGFVPPEVISGEGFSEKCDVFALGVILYQMIAVNLPFTVQRFSSTQLFNEAQNLVNYNRFPDNFSPLLCDLLKKMLQPDQERRSFLIELIDHPWLKNTQMQSSASANDLLSDSHRKGLNNLTLSSNFPKNVNNIFNFPKYFEFLEHLNEQKRNKLRREEINMIIVKECARYSDVDANELIHLLIEGEINTFTTLYYVLCGPFYERSQTGSGRLPPLCHGFIQNKMLKKQNQMFVFGSNPTLKKKPTITKVQSSVISQHSSALPKIPVKHHF